MNYKTTDMQLATVLSLNFPIKELLNSKNRGTFVFEDSTELRDMITGFYDKQLSVEPKTLLDNLKSIKDRLYATVKEVY